LLQDSAPETTASTVFKVTCNTEFRLRSKTTETASRRQAGR
jgi:hypothetical protein